VDVASKLGIHQTNALKEIKRFGFVLKLSVWVPHKLSEKNLMVELQYIFQIMLVTKGAVFEPIDNWR